MLMLQKGCCQSSAQLLGFQSRKHVRILNWSKPGLMSMLFAMAANSSRPRAAVITRSVCLSGCGIPKRAVSLATSVSTAGNSQNL